MKHFLLIITSLMCALCFSQENNDILMHPKKSRRVYMLGIKADSVLRSNPDSYDDLYTIVKSHKKRNRNRLFGGIFLTAGLAGMASGIATIATPKEQEAGFARLGGVVLFLSGTTSYLFSIPFTRAAKRRKAQRDELIEKYSITTY